MDKDFIVRLKLNEVFVFGSNLAGRHGRGAALQARVDFGAEDGVGEGLTGRCYAFPTLDHNLRQLPQKRLEQARDLLFITCNKNRDKVFLLTKVGCGLAGFAESRMRDLFEDAPSNLVVPKGW